MSATAGVARVDTRLRIATSDARVDAGWDAFVASAPGGTHLQSTMWAEVKRPGGWEATRVVALEGARIVGGCQLLLRRVSRIGDVAYVARGPLWAAGRPDVAEAVLAALLRLAADRRLLYVKLQPPEARPDLGPILLDRGWAVSDLEVAPSATVRVDLSRHEEQLRATLRTSVRRNIGIAERGGVEVRDGGADDIDRFGELVTATGRRQGFPAYPAAYYARMWQAFAPGDHVRLLLAERGGELLAASLVIGFGDSATYKMGGWSGTHPELRASTLVHWRGMLRARADGHRYYDFDGVSASLAARVAAGDRAAGGRGGVDHFKLGFGGDAVLLSPTFDRSFHPLGPGIGWAARRMRGHKGIAQRLLGRAG